MGKLALPGWAIVRSVPRCRCLLLYASPEHQRPSLHPQDHGPSPVPHVCQAAVTGTDPRRTGLLDSINHLASPSVFQCDSQEVAITVESWRTPPRMGTLIRSPSPVRSIGLDGFTSKRSTRRHLGYHLADTACAQPVERDLTVVGAHRP
jgi:hypothetical protein